MKKLQYSKGKLERTIEWNEKTKTLTEKVFDFYDAPRDETIIENATSIKEALFFLIGERHIMALYDNRNTH